MTDMDTPVKKRKNWIILVVFGVIGLGLAVGAFIIARNVFSTLTAINLPGAPQAIQPVTTDEAGNNQIPVGIPNAPSAVELPKWNGKTRITVLFLGLDYRDWEAGEIPRSDTMMLVTLDPLAQTVGFLSIPRDMWVEIPGFGHNKINTAYFLGEVNKLPGGGPGLAMETVEHFLGVPVDYYALVDFMTFVDLIDELGGLDLYVRQEVTISRIGDNDSQEILREGVQWLDGMQVLGYARSRYTDGGDFDRAARQQEVIMAIKDQVVTWNMLPELIAKAPALYQEVNEGINTNLNLDDMLKLANLGVQIPRENFTQKVIGPDMVYSGTSPDGLSIMIPIPDDIRGLRDQVFTNTPISQTVINSDLAVLRQTEGARIAIHNGTQDGTLASRTAEYFRSQGLNVVEETNAQNIYNSSQMIIYHGKPYTASYLAGLLGIPNAAVTFEFNPDNYADIVLILGNDWASSNPLP
jgi:polyisoprenyl-teichoic acid--peptidoglycan teichoic acid transferase